MTREKLKNDKVKIIFGFVLIAIGVLSRTVWHFGDNVEMVTATTLLAGSYLGLRSGMVVPVLIMVVSDLILGNSDIFIFTWSAYLVIGCIGYSSRLSNLGGINKILLASVMGVASSAFFYFWTNFGVWLLDSWGMYPKNISGLIDAYVMGIPFFRNNLTGNLIFVPVFFTLAEFLSGMESRSSIFNISGKKARII